MNIAWLGGWAIPKKHVLDIAKVHYPKAEHHILYPGKYWKEHLPQSADFYIGYSFGAFLLLKSTNVLPKGAHIILLAPFLDIKSEAGLGGRVSVTQLKMLKRMMSKDVVQALNDFYQRADLRVRCQGKLPYHEHDLFWGIDQLIDGKASENNLADMKQVLIGTEDPLVDAAVVARHCKQLKLIENAGHRLADLLPFMQPL